MSAYGTVQVDVDGWWAYCAAYGEAASREVDPVYQEALPRLRETFDRHGIRATLFVVGTDMAVPLLISSRGYGLFFDNSWDAEVAFGRTEETTSLVYTAEGGVLDEARHDDASRYCQHERCQWMESAAALSHHPGC